MYRLTLLRQRLESVQPGLALETEKGVLSDHPSLPAGLHERDPIEETLSETVQLLSRAGQGLGEPGQRRMTRVAD